MTSKPLHSGKSIFGSKAETLARLKQHPSNHYTLCDQVLVSWPEWQTSKQKIINTITDVFAGKKLAARSSAANEDGWDQSLAGANLSLMNVLCAPRDISEAVSKVFESYPESNPADQALIQPMVENVSVSGVILSRDLDTGSPYFAVNYDDASGRTDTVTGGADSHTLLIYRDHPQSIHSSRFQRLIFSVLEIEALTTCSELDIEFCITQDEIVYILQVRPLAARQNWETQFDDSIHQAIKQTHAEIKHYTIPSQGVVGKTSILGEMPDWNPAEMIGTTPRPLALSLYKYLITDHIWADARAAMGYRHIPYPLLIDFHGRPYIDVRNSLNSFLPDGLDEDFSERLVNFQLSQLSEQRDLHDKIEFTIATTCRDFSFLSQCKKLRKAGFNSNDIDHFESKLHTLTTNALKQGSGGIFKHVQTSRQLLKIKPINYQLNLNPLEHVQFFLEECKIKGTLPFSIVARHAFIGMSFLKSLVQQNLFSGKDLNAFMRSIHTVASDFIVDLSKIKNGELPRKNFLDRYGHLRPGTYDILSRRYDSCPELYLGDGNKNSLPLKQHFSLDHNQEKNISRLLKKFGYNPSPDKLLEYVKQAVQAREEVKFYFTRNISDALHTLSTWGQQNGFSRDDLSFLNIQSLLQQKDNSELNEEISEAREKYHITRAIRLPHLICEADDAHVIRLPLGRPTFITNKSITAPAEWLTTSTSYDLENKIILIKSADPGFDWIFTHKIKGLITCFGGANSHMAIRCAEFGLPAAIGCGERLFNDLKSATAIELNCAAKTLTRS